MLTQVWQSYGKVSKKVSKPINLSLLIAKLEAYGFGKPSS